MELAVENIREAKDDGPLIGLLSSELQRLLPDELQQDRDRYHQTIAGLPRGLRAMAGMYFFEKSMALDSLAWHFGNQNDERDLKETLNGLRELELPEIADMFEQIWEFMNPHMKALQTEDFGGKDFADWLEEIGAEDFVREKDRFIWDYRKQAGDLGLLSSWPAYARKYPERCVLAEAHP